MHLLLSEYDLSYIILTSLALGSLFYSGNDLEVTFSTALQNCKHQIPSSSQLFFQTNPLSYEYFCSVPVFSKSIPPVKLT